MSVEIAEGSDKKITSKEWWRNADNAPLWLRRSFLYNKSDRTSGIKFFDKHIIDRIGDKFDSVLEVGAGDGHLIGEIHNRYKVKCSSVDINPELSRHVKEKYGIDTYIGDACNLSLPDNSFDLVFTHQVLQHISPEDIERALFHILRIAKKEVWLFEGWREGQSEHGRLWHRSDGGTWTWDISKFVKCEVEQIYGLRFYRIIKV